MTKKISQLPADSSPTTTDSIPTYDIETSLTKRVLISDLITLFFNNIPTGAHSDITRGSETFFDFVKPNTGVWSGDSYASNKNASMTAMTIYINGRRISISAVTARTFTASKDTYIDVLDNLDGTGTLVYTEVTNNAASPALASNSVRIGIIITGATTIASAGSVNQGQETIILPIASSIPYSVSDSLGNLICPRDPQRQTLGFRQNIAGFTLSSLQTTPTQVTALSCPIIAPLGRKILVEIFARDIFNATAANSTQYQIWDGVVNSGTLVEAGFVAPVNTAAAANGTAKIQTTPASASKTYNAGLVSGGLTNVTLEAAATTPAWIRVSLA